MLDSVTEPPARARFVSAAHRRVRRALTCLLAASVAWMATVPGIAAAQQTRFAGEDGLVIEHEPITSALAGEELVFEATVTRTGQVPQVAMHYRYTGGADYQEVAMKRATADGYVTDLGTDEGVNDVIEYWIEAIGPSGATARAGGPDAPFLIEVSTTPARQEAPDVPAPEPVIVAPDVVSPIIRHAPIPAATLGQPQRFEASVTDDVEVAGVTLFHRDAPEADFDETVMEPAGGDTFVASLPSADGPGTIEYFIEAEDTAGTRTTRGSAFSPLERRVDAPVVAAAPGDAADGAAGTPGESAADGTPPEPKKSRTLWYVLGGALAVGLLAGLAGGSGSDDDDDDGGGGIIDSPPPGDCCDVTFVVDTPR